MEQFYLSASGALPAAMELVWRAQGRLECSG
jgi:hypothetical protein